MGLRTLFYIIITLVNIPLALYRPFYGLLVYAFMAYSRPSVLVWGDIFSKFRISFITGIVLVISTFLHKEKFYAENKRVFLIILFWILCYISLFVSGLSWSYSFEVFSKVLIVILITTGLVNTKRKFYLFCLVIAGFISLYASRQGILATIRGSKELSGHVGENNYYGCWLSTMLPFIFYLAKTEKKKWLKIYFYCSLPLIFYALLATYSRGAYVGIAAVFMYLIAHSKYKMKGIIVAVILALLFLRFIPSGIKQEARSLQDSYELGRRGRGRVHFWKVALNMTARNPLTGIGFGQFEDKYDNYDKTSGEYGRDRAVHSAFFEVLSEVGIPGFIIFITLFAITFIAGRRIRGNLRDSEDEDSSDIINWSYMLEASLVGFSFSALFISAAFLDILWYIFALSIALEEIAKKKIIKQYDAG